MDLFRHEDRGGVCLDNEFWDADDLITVNENLELEPPLVRRK
jgi:hypothetical protein